MAGLQGIKGLFEKRGFLYYQPPTPKGGGKRPTAVALGTKSLSVALEKLRGGYEEVRALTLASAGTMGEVLPRYYHAKRHDEKATRLARRTILEGFRDACGNPPMIAITAKMIAEWRDDLADPERGGRRGWAVSAATLKSYTITLRAFLRWAVEERVIPVHPLPKMEKHMRLSTTRVEEFCTEDEREALLAAPCEDYVRLILMLGFFAGLRDGEMLAFNPGWLWIADDWSRGTLTVRETPIKLRNKQGGTGKQGVWKPKWGKQRKIPLHPRLLAFLKEYGLREPYLIRPEKDEWPDESMNAKRFDAKKALAGVAKRAGVEHLTFHRLRHSFATHLAMKGVALAEIAGLLGDTLGVTEKHYAGFCPNKVNPLSVL